jgi:tryptophanyl-tRNA synthetase
LLADAQALTDNIDDPEKVRSHVIEVALDYLAVGIDPGETTICVQSALPALAELAQLYLNFVSVARLERNPTIKDEIQMRGFERDIPAGFLCYPVAQAADITAFKATVVPVGLDQAPMIEQTNEIVRRINRQVGRELLVEAKALIPATGRLPGADGKTKMSKSQGNAISLAASPNEISAFVRRMYTDPNHLRASDPGVVEGNVVFAYLDAFDPDRAAVDELKDRYRRGGLGDVTVKRRLDDVLQALLKPIRERREAVSKDLGYVRDVLRSGTSKARAITQSTLDELRDGLGLFSLDRTI